MNDIVANTKKLSELIEYQENSIVSKVLIKKKAGNVTLFAFWENQELSEHTSPFDALVYCIEGEGNVKIDDQNFVLQGGDLILMPANHPHSVKATTNFKMLLTMIKDLE